MTQQLTPKEKQEVQGQEQTRPGRSFVPAVDIWEDEEGLRLQADMPGVDPEHVSVELNDDVLSLEGHVDLSAYEGLTPVYTEYNVGHFQRRFTIPAGERYDRDRVNARLTNGVLEIVLPRAEAAKPRRIAITAA
jgi:HSP20 family molecular chaperone IbpA